MLSSVRHELMRSGVSLEAARGARSTAGGVRFSEAEDGVEKARRWQGCVPVWRSRSHAHAFCMARSSKCSSFMYGRSSSRELAGARRSTRCVLMLTVT